MLEGLLVLGRILLLLGVPVFGLFVPAWTFSDAMKHSSGSALAWAIVSMVPVLGLLAYLRVGRDELAARPTEADLPPQFREGSDQSSSSSPAQEIRHRKRISSEEQGGFIPMGRNDDE